MSEKLDFETLETCSLNQATGGGERAIDTAAYWKNLAWQTGKAGAAGCYLGGLVGGAVGAVGGWSGIRTGAGFGCGYAGAVGGLVGVGRGLRGAGLSED
jgi:hypothetical protein